MNRTELKSQAKQQIKGKIGILFVISFIIVLITYVAQFILSLIPFGSFISTIIITPAFTLSLVRVYLNVAAGTKPSARDAFCGFDDFWSAFKLNFLVGLFTFLWSLLFIIPGIVKSYSYSMSMYILAENKGKPALECINESKEMTNGHKMDLFILGLSFFGWILLGCVTLGIAYIWIIPYMETTYINAYNSLKPAKKEVKTETEAVIVEAPEEATTEEKIEETASQLTEETQEN